jgi:hypothetical protein
VGRSAAYRDYRAVESDVPNASHRVRQRRFGSLSPISISISVTAISRSSWDAFVENLPARIYAPAMATPYDRTTLHAEVDERYHSRHPTAPYTIDPDDATHQPWIPVWIEIRDEVLIAATNEYFFEQYPGAPAHLDPNDPAQELYVKEWIRIRDEILGNGVTGAAPDATDASDSTSTATDTSQQATAPRSADQFDQEATRVREYVKGSMDVNQMSATDAAPIKFIDQQIDVARSMYLGGHFDRHDVWTSETRDFDVGVGFNNFGLQVRVVGADRSVRMGLVGDGPSDVGGWQGYQGAPTQ